MPFYEPTTKDIDFVLHDVLKVSEQDIPGFDELDRDFTGAVLEEAGKIARDVLAPLNTVGDHQGCKLDNGVVRVPAGFEDAVNVLRDGGWTGFDCDPEYGGQGMPYTLSIAVGEMHSSANMALMMYPGLTHGCYAAIHAHGTDEQKAKYLPNLVSFKWGGTMNLTEPQCGTDLGLIRTKAEPQDDGTYKLSGQKIWISAGEHEMAENIIHLVLAKIPGGPDGIKGISLFIVPKFMVNDDGSLGERNAVSCGGLESKMGIHGNATCVMNYDGATGYLIGDLHKGMRAMFTMMNEARLGVGMQGLAQASVAYQNALAFAKDRIQGRAVTGTKEPEKAADSIIHFPDVRRMLMDQKSFVEGGRAFMLWAATMIDRSRRNNDADAEGMVSLLIPVLKGFLTDKGLDATISSQQVYGGSGFTTEWGAEQFVRDCRIALIYEGTNGIQALDLVGRKLASDNGKHVMAFFELVKTFIKDNADDARMAEFITPLKAASKDLQAAGMYFMQNAGKPDDALSGAADFMHLFGHVCLGLMWGQIAKASYAALDAGNGDTAFYESKLVTGRYYMTRKLPETAFLLQKVQAGGANVMGLDVANF